MSYQPIELDQPAPLRRTSCQIVDEGTVSHVLSKWTRTLVDCSLELAAEVAFRGELRCRGHQNVMLFCQILALTGLGWTLLLVSTNPVPGDTKGIWKMAHLHYGRDKVAWDEFLKPLTQVSHYAHLSGTRYIYVISDRELVCIRRSISEYEDTPLAHHH